MPQKTLLELREGLNVRQDDDWCGVHAIARAQHAELVGPTADQGKDGHPRQERRIRDVQVMQDEVARDLGQIMYDMPLVEVA